MKSDSLVLIIIFLRVLLELAVLFVSRSKVLEKAHADLLCDGCLVAFQRLRLIHLPLFLHVLLKFQQALDR